MSTPHIQPIPRVLGIDPTTYGFAYTLLEGPRTLIDWSVVHVKRPVYTNSLARLGLLIGRFRPHLIAVEDLAQGTRRGEGARNLIRGVEMLGFMRHVRVRRVTRREMEDALQLEETTKYEIACAIADHFPELAPRLPRKRKPWMSEDERMNIFDAAGIGLAALTANGES